MSEIHEVNNSILSVFAAPARDISIDSYSFVEILEKSNTNQLAANLPYYEIILNDRNSWLNLSDAYLEVRARIKTVGDATIFSGQVAPISDLQNLFRRAEMWIENKSVQTVEYPGVVSQVIDLIKNAPDYKKSGSAELHYPDLGAGGQSAPVDGVLTATAAGVATTLAGSAADPHVLTIAAGNDNDQVVLIAGGMPLIVRKASDGTVVNLFKHGGGANQPIDNNGGGQFIANDILYMYDIFGRRVYLKTSGVPTQFVTQLAANGNIDLTFVDGNGNAIAANNIYGYQAAEYTQNDDLDNPSFLARKLKFLDAIGRYASVVGGGTTFYIPMRKIFSFWDYNRHVWKGATMRFRLDRDTNYEYIYRNNLITTVDNAGAIVAAADTECRAYIDYMSLWVPVVKPNPLIDAKLNKAVSDNASALASWYDNEFYENSIITLAANSTQEQIWKVTSKTERVVRVFMWLQRTDARTSQLVNKGVYGGYNISSAQCAINGVIYPRTKYDLDPNSNYNYTRLYNEFLRAGGHVATPSTGTVLSIEEWFRLYEIICFDLSYQPDSDKVYTGRISPSDIELRVKLNTAAAQDFRMYAIVQTERYAKAQAQSDMIKLL